MWIHISGTLPEFFSGYPLIRLVGFTCSVGMIIMIIPFAPMGGKIANWTVKPSFCHIVSLVVTLRHDVRSPGCKSNYEIFVVVSKPQNMGITLTTQTTGSFRSFIVELQICNSPTSQRNFALCFKFSELQRRLPQIEVAGNINQLRGSKLSRL